MSAIPDAVLLPLPIAGPMAVAALLLMFGHVLPRHVPDAVGVLVAALVAGVCALLAVRAGSHPIVSWFGGWEPRDGLVLGIGFAADRASAIVATLVGVLFTASFVFAWSFFDRTNAHFHVLMLLFLAAMVGFSLTHDLFNLFVWFEIMSVSAFALTGIKLEGSALSGAMNFTVTNSVAAYIILAGIGLVYTRAGALDFSAIAQHVAAPPPDPVVAGAFCLIVCGLLIKAAAVPFHFWLADAHAVAPSPVCVLFSGAMVSLGLFAVAKLASAVFASHAEVAAVMRTAVLGLGAAGSLVGGAMALSQRHVKRMLAFSTIGHSGIMLAGLATFTDEGTAGMLVYVVGHGLIKGALFMVAGILLATRAAIDEIDLRGLGREGIWPAGLLMALGGLVLGGLPFGITDEGFELIDSGLTTAGRSWIIAVLAVGAALTGGAILRATGRIFLGLGPDPGSEADAPTEEEQEKADRPFWLMATPAIALVTLAFCPGDLVRQVAETAIHSFAHPDAAAFLAGRQAALAEIVTLPSRAPHPWVPWLSLAGSLVIAGYSLSREFLPAVFRKTTRALFGPLFRGLETLHSGLINDYVAWIAIGIAAIVAAFAF